MAKHEPYSHETMRHVAVTSVQDMETDLHLGKMSSGKTEDLFGQARRGASFWRAVRWPVFAAAALCLAFGLGFVGFATYVGTLSTPRDLDAADGIIVVTGGQSRVDAAVDLMKSGKGKRLLISGVHPTANREALRAATGGDRKMFSCCVDIDYEALDTIGNATESAKWVRQHSFESVILVTNNYHIPRTLLEMRRLLGDAVLQPYPVVNRRLDGGRWIDKPEALRVLFTEYTKYVAALARAVVDDAAPAADVEVVRAGSTLH